MFSRLLVIVCCLPLVRCERDGVQLTSINIHNSRDSNKLQDKTDPVESKSSQILDELKDEVGTEGGPSELQEAMEEAEKTGAEAHEATKEWSKTGELAEKAVQEVDQQIRTAKDHLVDFHERTADKVASGVHPVLDKYVTGEEKTEGYPKAAFDDDDPGFEESSELEVAAAPAGKIAEHAKDAVYHGGSGGGHSLLEEEDDDSEDDEEDESSIKDYEYRSSDDEDDEEDE
mmetsp:Transcript_49596/g.91507  ORF Transcript_49596/g.91507 Transcript_49596/m.91507 type:complete len:230 (+) Transcript_49596:122-811(+)